MIINIAMDITTAIIASDPEIKQDINISLGGLSTSDVEFIF